MKTYKYEVGVDDAVKQILALADGQPFEIVQILEIPRSVMETQAAADAGITLSRFAVFVDVDPQIDKAAQRMHIIIELFANRLHQLPIHKQDSISYYDAARVTLETEKRLVEDNGYKIVWIREGWVVDNVNN